MKKELAGQVFDQFTGRQFQDMNSWGDVSSFLRLNFEDRGGELEGLVDSDPWQRVKNPDYRRFFARVIAMAAEYGFQSYSMFTEKSNIDGAVVDPLDPRYLMFLASYLADITFKQEETKEILLDVHRQEGVLTEGIAWEIRAGMSMPKDGIPQSSRMLDKGDIERALLVSMPTRIPPEAAVALPLYLPDMGFNQAVRDVGFTKQDIFLGKEAFWKTKLPHVQKAFGKVCDAGRVFQQEAWPIVPVIPRIVATGHRYQRAI